MARTAVSSSGRIIEFNQQEKTGVIQETETGRLFKFSSTSVKKHSKRYLTGDEKYTDELFDFDIAGNNSLDSITINDPEAINVRHCVLMCTVDGCTRLKAFTHMKALEEHILVRHTLKKQKEEVANCNPSPVSKTTTKSKKQRRTRSKPTLIKLSTVAAPAVTGRFIGKQGENLKRLEQAFSVRLKIIDTRLSSQPLQILISSNPNATVNVESVKNALELEWRRCVAQQASIERSFSERLRARNALKHQYKYPSIDITSDPRYRDDTKFRLKRQRREIYFGRKKLRQTESSIRMQERHSELNREGHRSSASCAMESRLKSIFNFYQSRKLKNKWQENFWLRQEELQLESLFIE